MQTENPTPRDKRVLKAHRKRYIEDKDLSTIAEEMGYGYDTIRDYFRDESTQRIKRLYDDEEIEFMRVQLLQELDHVSNVADECVAQAKKYADSSRAYNDTAKTAANVLNKRIKMLQELGLLEKPKERKEVEQTSGEVVFNEELVTERQENNEEQEEEVEAE